MFPASGHSSGVAADLLASRGTSCTGTDTSDKCACPEVGVRQTPSVSGLEFSARSVERAKLQRATSSAARLSRRKGRCNS